MGNIRKPVLRAVAPDEAPAPKKPMTILEAAEADDRLEELRSLRRRIARALDDPNTLARDLASLSRRQIEISREIEALQRQESEEASDAANIEDEEFDVEAI
ncbi:hypothetical protein ACTJJ4_11620 [Microbacterium sp. 22195]|uniref:hypothetical protein n=1 Tax=Microbacterium sp. 22195 TaxID=3453891 RepID=UPI003F8424AD